MYCLYITKHQRYALGGKDAATAAQRAREIWPECVIAREPDPSGCWPIILKGELVGYIRIAPGT